VAAARTDAQRALLDVRSGVRFRGEEEPLDAVAGHIPGARNAPHTDSLQPDGSFRSAAELRAHFDALLPSGNAADCILYCGSGVTAAHTALALQHAGHKPPRVYAGSWSEWITDPARPVATGAS
jgi:thiosulfate/3-mercaptopyruvate sulfurtransferase